MNAAGEMPTAVCLITSAPQCGGAFLAGSRPFFYWLSETSEELDVAGRLFASRLRCSRRDLRATHRQKIVEGLRRNSPSRSVAQSLNHVDRGNFARCYEPENLGLVHAHRLCDFWNRNPQCKCRHEKPPANDDDRPTVTIIYGEASLASDEHLPAGDSGEIRHSENLARVVSSRRI